MREDTTEFREYRAGETEIDFGPLGAVGQIESLPTPTQIAPITRFAPEVIVRNAADCSR
jgi:hypothetical protein